MENVLNLFDRDIRSCGRDVMPNSLEFHKDYETITELNMIINGKIEYEESIETVSIRELTSAKEFICKSSYKDFMTEYDSGNLDTKHFKEKDLPIVLFSSSGYYSVYDGNALLSVLKDVNELSATVKVISATRRNSIGLRL